ncbi:flagellar biosynthesis protein FlgF [Methylobacterium sp. Leaf399]|uniref:flagellar basal-body rod protein FlgF n=1 Tax=unclassified Methylobacterium TaxID=2615210 RepID=UPI0006F9812C|nr:MULTISPECIES: flagellar basal-body rod protein FlgF [unclassified Methylobacterium]KQT19781.1 flagellar biosynthesis protein FlgF [Methylobacterium sp. Leaf399]KQT80831.1 flagellar biosynthesis protein FlgF [Methylobacterium sp. Leaf466]
MQNGLYVALSAQVNLEKRLNAVANNVANLSTAGYRAEDTHFEALLAQASKGPIAFTSAGDTFISRRAGPVSKTDSPLDVAIQGDAWLSVGGTKGPVYTRDGRMKMDANGQLRNMSGQPVLDPGGGPLLLDPQAGPPKIGRDGSIYQGESPNINQVGALGLFTIDPRARLTRAEANAVSPSVPAERVQDFTRMGVIQGHIEGANVNPVMEMTKLITIQRAFESAATLTSETENSFAGAIRSLSPQG